MAPNKFEKHIKKQLENREIQPSSDAWLKVSDQLDEHRIEPPSKKGYFWYAVAACLIGLIVVSTIFFSNGNAAVESTIEVVEREGNEKKAIEDVQPIDSSIPAIEAVAHEESPIEPVKRTSIEKKIPVQEKEHDTEPLANTSQKTRVALNDNSEDLINTKLLEVLAQVDALEQGQEQVTDAEVDSLLRKAQEELLTDALFRDNHTVDAMALLSEVEGELDKSFRDQIFESLKSGFFKVRTAVADRNN